MTNKDKIKLCSSFSLTDHRTIHFIKEDIIPWLHEQIKEVNELIGLIGSEGYLLTELDTLTSSLNTAQNRLLLVI